MPTLRRLTIPLALAAGFVPFAEPVTGAMAATPVRAAVMPSAAAGEVLGPPWMSIEYPVNPHDQTTRGAFLLVHAFHHGTPVAMPVSGTAEGIVNGERKSVPLSFRTTSRTGAYALMRQWPNEGTWTLVLAVAQGKDDRVQAVVDLAAGGTEVVRVQVPTRQQGSWTIPAPVVMADVEASLRTRAARQTAGRES